ncbi:MAG TPA: NAD-dependent epimerase/dehydratase family protein [Bacillota bacterium]|nr:NAD-dependent epimerase/dehydratase family protein [Bacillota bacterium]HPE38000.1 NAD-dependent epimerase/dehydratase family protein [Bacillota bacterium]
MRILVIGGTRYFGIHLVNALLAKNHEVTIATRGLTPDIFGDRVERIIFDRTDRKSVIETFTGLSFDVVYDNINYSPYDTENLLHVLQTNRYVFTSSTAVYSMGENHKEEDFDAYSYLVRMGRRDDFTYEEGKRLCESVLFQNFEVPAVAVRFPIVIGKDDYTRRLYTYVDAITKGKPIHVTNPDVKLSFIESHQAGEFLSYLCERDEIGPMNASCKGEIAIMDVISYIEKKSGRKALYREVGVEGEYNPCYTNTVDISRAESTGFTFDPIRRHLYEIIDEYVAKAETEI